MTQPSPDIFTFAMGEFTAEFPLDRNYVTNHMWAKRLENQHWRFGLSAYAVRLLQDVYFLDWIVDAGTDLSSRAHIGSIESKKAESDLYAPASGTIISLNDSLLDDPSTVNADTYGQGWMFDMRLDPPEETSLLSPDQYETHLEKAWEIAQKTIKGQANQ